MKKTFTKSSMCATVALFSIASALCAMGANAQDRLIAPQVLNSQKMDDVAASVNAEDFNAAGVSSSAELTASNADDATALPDAPSATLRGSYVPVSVGGGGQDRHTVVAPIYAAYIPAGWTAQPLTGRNKVILGLRDATSPFSFLGILASAGYSHLTNGEPNYGTDRGAFGQRLGAAAIRDTMEDVLADSVFAPILHEDPRYYVEGNQYNFFHRVIYAATRPVITRTDGGRQTVNAAVILGSAASSAASYAYYPKINQNFKDTVSTFGGSLGGVAVGDLVSEFSDQILVTLHLKKAQ